MNDSLPASSLRLLRVSIHEIAADVNVTAVAQRYSNAKTMNVI